MKKWEYTWVVAGTDPFDSVKIEGKNYRIDEWLGQLGAKGWELVSVTLQDGSTTHVRKFTYWFKRPIE